MEEATILLNRLYNAARAYYLMKEESIAVEGATVKIHNDLIKEEFVAALVAVKLITEPVKGGLIMSGEVDVVSLRYHANRRREWAAAQVLFNDAYAGKTILLEPGETLEFAKIRLP